jgi:hypothetical protein
LAAKKMLKAAKVKTRAIKDFEVICKAKD